MTRFERAPDAAEPTLLVEGDLDVATSPPLQQAIDKLLGDGFRTVVVDLGALEFIDSAGLGVLVGSLRRARERGGDVVLANLEPPALRVFEVTGLTKLFELR